MIKNFNSCILALILCWSCFCPDAEAQDIQAVAKLEQTAIRIGDQTKLRLSVFQRVKQTVGFPAIADTLNSKIQVISSSKQDTIPDENDPEKITVTKSYVITSFDAGSYTLPAFVFTAKEGALKTNELILLVQSVKVDTTKAIYDIKQPLAVSYTFTDWIKDNWQWVLFPLLGIILIAGLVWYLMKRRGKKPVIQVNKPSLPAHTIALAQLTELRNKKLWQQEQVKEYYSELSDVLREYLEKRYQIKTHEKTTDEIFEGLSKVAITAENKNILHGLLMTADLVKFAKGKPLPVENERSIEDAVIFVSNTAERKTERPENTKENAENTKGGDGAERI
ncbi:hypothetical protein [Pedobacter hartonius]|uniref:Oxygen tolerance n=1 Tax=Pedobacter hartonius TaxID=425514 RepID=A0A1H4G803_9SPHI|nr:hypothetical protein [Pedobacter hartonius]SEB05735.1 hypothetical protein SAMN05443550_109106 [Pedobacter hartonius]